MADVFCDSGIVDYDSCSGDEEEDDEECSSTGGGERYSGFCGSSTSYLCYLPHKWHSRIPVATWRLAELEFFKTRIPIAKWRLKEFYMEKKKMYRGTATSFGFKKPAVTSSNIINNSKIPSFHPNNPAPFQEKLTDSAESLDTAHNLRNGTPRLPRTKKDTTSIVGKPNRFGFRGSTPLSNKVADTQNNMNSTKANLRLDSLVSQGPKEVKSCSNLPRPQFPVRLAAPAGYRGRSVDKNAKTVANNHTARRSRSEHGGSSASSVNDADSGVGSHKSGNELEMIEQLECSPSARNRLRNGHKSRPMEMIFTNGHEKKFELRDLRDGIEVTEIVSLELPPLGKRLPQGEGLVRQRAKAYSRQLSHNSGSSEDDEGIEESGEEKVHRDRVLSEKDEKGVFGAGEEAADGDDLWGHGEAMVGEEDMPGGQDLDSDQGRQSMSAPLRSVLLSIEDHSFAALAAMSTSVMLEDESYPELPEFHNSLSLTSTSAVTSPNEPPRPSLPQQETQEKKNLDDSPGSPSTPTHNSNSLSFSSDIRDRDFIDDEICDQPGLIYDNVTANSSGNTIVADDICPSPRPLKPLSAVANLTVDCSSARHSSVGTLSPCESITSDDLIMDYDISGVDDDHRLDASSLDLPLTDGEGEEGEGAEQLIQDCRALLSSRPELGH